MERKEFIRKTFQYGVGSCLGMYLLSNSNVLAAINRLEKMDGKVEDGFLKLFGWIKHALEQNLTTFFKESTTEYDILKAFKNGWGVINTAELFIDLKDKYGDKAVATIREFIKMNTIPYWTGVGKEKAQKGSEIEDFIKVLWAPMGDDFEFTKEIKEEIYKFCVTKCPFAKLANGTNTHEWVYNMACITDFYMTPAFSKEIGFLRTKTMVQADENCNHTYYYKDKAVEKDSLLGYCGLYCGGCPSNQNTKAYTPINYDKKNVYETCEGCNSKMVAKWCSECTIKECAGSKNVRVCLDCDEYPCDKMTAFIEDKKYPYHKEVEEKMKEYKEQGLEKWLIAQEKSYYCKNCGKQYNFFETTCSKCGTTFIE